MREQKREINVGDKWGRRPRAGEGAQGLGLGLGLGLAHGLALALALALAHLRLVARS